MLDFYLGTGGIDNLGEHLGGISMEGIFWMQQNGLLLEGSTGHLPEDKPESLPYFDDVVLTAHQVTKMYKKFKMLAEEIRRTPGFKNNEMDKLEKIFARAIEDGAGLSTLAD